MDRCWSMIRKSRWLDRLPKTLTPRCLKAHSAGLKKRHNYSTPPHVTAQEIKSAWAKLLDEHFSPAIRNTVTTHCSAQLTNRESPSPSTSRSAATSHTSIRALTAQPSERQPTQTFGGSRS